MNRDPESAELAQLIAKSLRLADEQGLVDVGISLDKALALLTGSGILPPALAQDLDDISCDGNGCSSARA